MNHDMVEAARKFMADDHIRHVLNGPWLALRDETGNELPGIRGRSGVASADQCGVEMGVDLIEMDPGAEFKLHTHPGDHILFILPDSVAGLVHINGIDHLARPGDTVFIPAELAHGVKTFKTAVRPLRFLAFGRPHKHVNDTDRMKLVNEDGSHVHPH